MNPELIQVLTVLVSWAAHLSGYPMPDQLPTLAFMPHKFFVDTVCKGQECKVVGLYQDTGVIYIDDRYEDIEEGWASSLVVHEATHYLQHLSGRFSTGTCNDMVNREREAYYVQEQYQIVMLSGARDLRKIIIPCEETDQ